MNTKMDTEMTLFEVLNMITTNNIKDLDNYGLWYDWFCSTASLQNRGVTLLTRLKSIRKSNKFDPFKTYVFFKNNCPCVGGLYDDFRICDKETGNVLFTISPRNNHGEAEVWGRDNGFNGPLVTGKWADVKAFFLS